MVSGHPKSTGIPRVDGLSTGPPDLGCHTSRQVGVCAWYWLFTILGECVVSSEIGTTSKIETHGCIK